MAATDLQQSKKTPQITGPLGDFVEFKNGRSSPDRTDSGAFAVYGSNGEIGKADVTNAPEGTLVVGRVGSYCGSVHYSPNKCWVTDNAIIGSSRSQKDSRFWFYKLESLDLNNYRAGSGQPLLNQQILNSIQVSIPASEDDRIQIARVLAVIDDKIGLNRRINQTLEAMAQAIFKSWFVDFDPVKAKLAAIVEGRDPLRAAMSAISGKSEAEIDTLPPEQFEQLATTAALFPDEMEQSKLGEIPRGWSASPFGSLLSHTIGGDWGSDSPDSSNDTRVAIIRGTDIPDLDLAQAHRVPFRYTTQKKLASRHLQVGDIVLEVSGGSKDQPTGRSIRIAVNTMREFDCPIEPASFCRLLRPISPEIGVILGLHLAYIYAQGKTWEYQNQSTGIANFQTAHFLDAEFVAKPPTMVAEKFYGLVNPLLERRHDPQSRRLTALRDSLLPKLLSGELSVTEAIAEAEA